MPTRSDAKRHPVIVVGDKFQSFALGKDNVLTMSQVRSLLMLPWHVGAHSFLFVPGQGLSKADLELVAELASNSPQSQKFDLSPFSDRGDWSGRTLSHKHHPQNTLIGIPKQISDNDFEIDVLLDESSELMLDHQTGQHIQGMILVEAGRQAFLAVTEMYFLPQEGMKYYFVINNMDTEFSKFVFPVDLIIKYQVTERDEPGAKRHRAKAKLTFEQAGEEVARMAVSFTAYEEAWIAQRETALASTTCQAVLATITDRYAVTPAPSDQLRSDLAAAQAL